MFWNSSDRRKQEELKRQQEQEGKLYETQKQKTIYFFKIIFQNFMMKKTRNSEILSSTIFQTGCSPFLMIHFFLSIFQENVRLSRCATISYDQ
jgi:hypothetical protein